MDPPIERDDDLFWLRDDDRKDPAIIAHLEAENAHTEAHLAHVQPLAKRVYDEIIGSIQETDDDVPFRWGDKGHTYMVRTVKGKAYPIVVRKIDEDKDWETVLDVNAVAAPLKYCSVGSFRPDPSHELLAYSIDPSGYETYEVRFKDLDTGAELPDVIKGTAGSVSWGHCDASTKYREVYYSTQDDAHRPDKVWRHVIGTDQSKDVCVLHEPDELFNVGFGKTSSGRFMLIESESTETNEVHYVDIAAGPGVDQSLTLMQRRRMGHRYYPEHRGDHWFVLTNRDGRINFDLVRARLTRPGEDDWASVPGVPGGGGEGCDGVGGGGGAPFQWSEGRTLESMSAFQRFSRAGRSRRRVQRHVGAPPGRTVRDAMSTPGRASRRGTRLRGRPRTAACTRPWRAVTSRASALTRFSTPTTSCSPTRASPRRRPCTGTTCERR